MLRYLLLTCLTILSLSSQAQAPAAPDTNSDQASAQSSQSAEDIADKLLASFKFQTGKISLPNGIATINLPESFRYLSPADSEKLLVDGWGNPPGNKTLGMLIPSAVSPMSAEGWGIVITYDEDGHVKDEDADKIDYASLLEDMKKESKENNEERKKQGYGSMLLVGWAEPPRYDKQARKLFWAKEYATEREGENSLNYNIRILGRKGVLVLNAVASMKQIAQIKQEMPSVLAVTEFTEGNRYADFDSKTDHLAEYGLAALVAGGVAAKLGFFAKLGVLLLALKKFIIIGFVAVAAFVKKLFSKKS